MKWITDIVSGAIAPIAGIFSKREDRKKAVAIIKAQTSQGTAEGETSVKLSNAQWDLISKKNEQDTWKDEYVTILITSPMICILLGNLIAAFTGDTRLLEANSSSLAQLSEVGIDMGELMLWTVLAALGIKAVK